MSLIKVQGDLVKMALDGNFDVIVHGCNCFNTMGAGIARNIAKTFPSAYKVDQETRVGSYNKLGTYTYSVAFVTDATGKQIPLTVINAYTQYNYGGGKDLFEYTAFDLILQKLEYNYPLCKFGFPYIGMGLAGGDSKKIMKSLNKFAKNMKLGGGSVTLVEYKS